MFWPTTANHMNIYCKTKVKLNGKSQLVAWPPILFVWKSGWRHQIAIWVWQCIGRNFLAHKQSFRYLHYQWERMSEGNLARHADTAIQTHTHRNIAVADHIWGTSRQSFFGDIYIYIRWMFKSMFFLSLQLVVVQGFLRVRASVDASPVRMHCSAYYESFIYCISWEHNECNSTWVTDEHVDFNFIFGGSVYDRAAHTYDFT